MFDITYSTVSISGLTMSNGHTTGNGGGIYNDANLGTANLWVLACTLSGMQWLQSTYPARFNRRHNPLVTCSADATKR